jgi:protein-S-isoprenylcysteine O-methyltransferase Ste14
MSRSLILIYGILSYVVGMGGLVFFILFLGGWDFLPFYIDSAEPGSLSVALLVNTGLMILLGLQHSVMARPGFKDAVIKVIPPACERSTYVLLSGVVFFLICFYWQAIVGTIWHVNSQLARNLLTAIQLFGWALVVASSFVINHFELFGLQQVYYYFVGKPEPSPNFTDRFLYKIVRHPLQLGVLIGIWFTATMTMSHLMLSVAMTLYIFVGLYLEEKDLVATLGQDYENYQKRVRMILPIPKRSNTAE